jgi:hypothetical protein
MSAMSGRVPRAPLSLSGIGETKTRVAALGGRQVEQDRAAAGVYTITYDPAHAVMPHQVTVF